MTREKTFHQEVEHFIQVLDAEIKKRELSGNETRRLLKLRSLLAKLCPETDGLRTKHRIRYVPEGNTRLSKEEDLLGLETEIVLPGIAKGENSTTQRISRLISLIYQVEGFTQEEVYRSLCNKRFRNRN